MNNQQAIDRLVGHLEWGWSEETSRCYWNGDTCTERNSVDSDK